MPPQEGAVENRPAPLHLAVPVGKAVEPDPSPERAVSGQAHQQQVGGQMPEVLPPEARPASQVLDRGNSGPQVELAPIAGGPSVVEAEKQVPRRLIRIDMDRARRGSR